ncbi:MAG TPA: glycogen-binding domain-containing protein [Candidatus Limnocylindria bacterium]|jgi:1,4-alpha-glucan branching enzyme|nr:glycogen-binding domain-containing protein [Candidatus Limnocylindria bacterium]
MKAKNPRKKAPETTAPRGVIFTYRDDEAREVCLAGSFNDWHPSSTPMVPLKPGHWSKEIMLAPGVYEYLFVVDGHWLTDPGAAVTVPNAFGGINCCVKVS